MSSDARPPGLLPSLGELELELSRRACERSLLEFVRQAWHVVEPGTDFVEGWHIEAICLHLEAVSRGEIRDLLINMPPRHMKSLLVAVFWPCWEWTRRPETRFLFSSYAQKLSTRDSLKCRRILESPWYQERWGERFALTSDQNEKMRFENNRTGYRIATSVGGTTTGEGGDIIVCDDPHNVQEADSDALRESACEWWFQAMSTRRNDPKTGRRVVVMQRVHEDDLSGQILDRGGYEHLCLPARFEPERACETGLGWCDPRTEDGELLWPEQCPEEELAKLERELGSAGAAGQMQQRPSPKGGLLIRESWWRFYGHGDPAGLYPFETPRELHDRADEVLQSWDCTFKDLKDSDWVVGTIWARIGAHKFLLAEYRGRWDLPATIAAIYRATADWERATLKLIEDKANGPAVMQTLRGQVTGLVPVEPQGGKIARVNAVSPQIEAGDVFLPHPRHAPWVGAYIDEHSRFPLGKHDDRVDSTSQALLRMRSGMAKPCGVNIPAPAGAYRPQRNSRFWGAR